MKNSLLYFNSIYHNDIDYLCLKGNIENIIAFSVEEPGLLCICRIYCYQPETHVIIKTQNKSKFMDDGYDIYVE